MNAGGIYFVPHGGGPLPLMGDPDHQGVVDAMRGLEPAIAESSAVIVITAHWEADTVQLGGAPAPGMIFDYYGFPSETYEYSYPAPGAPDLAARASAMLDAAGIANGIDEARGYDHGTFVPMMLMKPDAETPVLQMSLLSSLDPAAHIAVGRALAPLLADGVAIVGSGMSYHNLRVLLRGDDLQQSADIAFDNWLVETICGDDLNAETRAARMAAWADAPGARACHPREEHLLPLHVCLGAALEADRSAEIIYRDTLMGAMTSGFGWAA